MNRLPSRQRGRPQAHLPAARDHILDALIRLLDASPWSRTSLRSVAQEAGVTAALVHYHFEDLRGLMRCLRVERALPLLQPALPVLPLAPDLDAAAALVRFLRKWTALVRRHRWTCACLLQSPDDSGAGNSPGEPLRALVALAQQQGAIRADLPDTHVALLLLSMGVMPQLAQTALGAGLDGAVLDVDAASLTLRHLAVLQAGVVRSANPLS